MANGLCVIVNAIVVSPIAAWWSERQASFGEWYRHRLQEQAVRDAWKKIEHLESQRLGHGDGPFEDALQEAYMQEAFLSFEKTRRLTRLARSLGVAHGLPSSLDAKFYRQFDPEDDRSGSYFTSEGFSLAQDLVYEGQKRKRERVTLYAALFFGVAGVITSLITAVGSLVPPAVSSVEVLVKEPLGLSSLPPAIWRDPATFDPIEHFFLFPTTDPPKLKWTGEVRPLR